MSGNPKPKGREFNPHKAYAGTQTHRLVNGVFAVIVAVTLPLSYWYITRRAENSRINQWRGTAGFLDDSEHKTTQAALRRIREAKQHRDDPYGPLTNKGSPATSQ